MACGCNQPNASPADDPLAVNRLGALHAVPDVGVGLSLPGKARREGAVVVNGHAGSRGLGGLEVSWRTLLAQS